VNANGEIISKAISPRNETVSAPSTIGIDLNTYGARFFPASSCAAADDLLPGFAKETILSRAMETSVLIETNCARPAQIGHILRRDWMPEMKTAAWPALARA
jgi:hypothetical protein